MWDCIFVSGAACIPYFMATVLIGNLVILNLFLALLLSSFSGMGEGGGEEDDEPDKMQIAFGRFGRLKRFIIQKIKDFFNFIKTSIVRCFTGRKPNYDDMAERGENNLAMDVDNPEGLNSEPSSANSSKTSKAGSERQDKDKLLLSYMDKHMLLNDTNIGRGMDISVNNGELQQKENCSESIHSGDSGWRRSKVRSKESPEHDKTTHSASINSKYMEETVNVEEVFYDPVDEVVVDDCCPPVCYRVFPCCVDDPDSPFWQEWHKHRLQITRFKILSKIFLSITLMFSDSLKISTLKLLS